MEVIFVVLLFFLQCIEPVLIVIGLIWAVFAARRVYREIKSLRASRGDEAAMEMSKLNSPISTTVSRSSRAIRSTLWPPSRLR